MNAKQIGFIEKIAPAAQAAMEKSGIPASITIAQAILESGWGCSGLSERGNNYFGIKAKHGQDKIACLTSEYEHGEKVAVTADFARYASIEECFEAHTLLLSTNGRYIPAMAVAHDPALFAEQLQRCGYSTNPQYASSLMAIVRMYCLTRYDTLA